MKTLTDEQVLLTHDGRGIETKRLALAAIMARATTDGYNKALLHAAEISQNEPELPGDMPDEMWASINGDRASTVEALRIAVKQTKANISQSILACLNKK